MNYKYNYELTMQHQMGSISIAFADNKDTLQEIIKSDPMKIHNRNFSATRYYKIWEYVG